MKVSASESAGSSFRVATPASTFGIPIARTLGNCLSGSTYGRLVDLLGPARTKELIFRARLVSAELKEIVRAAHAFDAQQPLLPFANCSLFV